MADEADTNARASHVAATAAAPEGGAFSTATEDGAPEWPSLAPLKGECLAWWDWAVAAGVTALGRIVAPYVDVTATRIPPDHDAIVGKLRELGRGDDAVAQFQAAWDELGSTPDGRAVIAVCREAAGGGALLGRLHLAEKAEEDNLECSLARIFAGKEYLPVLLAAARYYKAHTPAASVPATAAAPEWPSLNSLTSAALKASQADPYAWSLADFPKEWYMAVAPAMVAAGRIVARYFPDLARMGVCPTAVSVVATLQDIGLDEKVPGFMAAWEELGSTPDGRAVIAVCAITWKSLGNADMVWLAGDPGLEDKLAKVYKGCDFLPVLQAAARYYRAQEPAATGAAAASLAAAAARGAAAAAYLAEASRAAAEGRAAVMRRAAAGATAGRGATRAGAGGGTRW